MDRITKSEQKIRDYVNQLNLYDRYYTENLDDWVTLCAAMDILGDTCTALEYYESLNISKQNNDGNNYLNLYGMLQAVFLQQDAIRKLHQVFAEEELINKPDSPWMKIRELRNLTVGHPLEKSDRSGGVKVCTISRISIKKDGFTTNVWNKVTGEEKFEDVNLKKIYNSYKEEAIKILKTIEKHEVTKWK